MNRVPRIFSTSFEIFAHCLPLVLLQAYNNSSLGKVDRPLDPLNMTLSSLIVVSIIAQSIVESLLSKYERANKLKSI